MRIGSNGYVGMGIANTNNQRITLAEADANGSHIKMNNSRTGGGYWVNGVGDDGSSASIVPPGGIFWYNGATRMVIDSAGNVGIGTTSPNQEGFGAGNRALSVKAPSSGGVANLELIGLGNADNDQLGYVNFMSQSATNAAAAIIGLRHTSDESGKLTFVTSGSERMRITSGQVN
jgi:hypothetical protein